ncbi:MAG: CoA ester lyase, partial [Clostridia bacterium]|nr:CoA ester lyase [Clostridia bacterium]
RPIFVRINAVPTGLARADAEAVFDPRLAGLVVPKVEDPDELRTVAGWLDELEGRTGADRRLELLPFIESARGLLAAHAIARSSDRVRRLAFGAVDYSLDLGLELTPDGGELAYPRAVLAVVSRAAGLEQPVDTVYPDFRDVDAVRRHAAGARALGFGGKLVIHPAQIPPVHQVFSPSAAEIERAREIVRAFQEAEAAGSGAVQWRGQMVELPIALRAQRTLEVARRLGLA